MKKILLLFISLLFCRAIFAVPLNEIIVFGDSLSDNGNLYNLTKTIPKSPPYYKGRFTNGPVWAEHVGDYYRDKYNMEYTIYAVGGATTILHNPIYDSFLSPITLEGELYNYYLNSLFSDKSKGLYVIWIGSNDYMYDQQPDTEILVSHVVEKISWAINSLINQGAQNFLIVNLPDLSLLPYSRNAGIDDRYRLLTLMHNQKLEEFVKNIKNSNPNTKIVLVDIYTIFNGLLNNPEEYNQHYHKNIKNLTQACMMEDVEATTDFLLHALPRKQAYMTAPSYKNTSLCTNPDEYFFWDQIHPTEAIHQMIAEIVIEQLSKQIEELNQA